MSVTMKDVAAAAGVSPSTVSRVLNSDPRISSSTCTRVKKQVSILGYRVNGIARSLKTSRTYTIGFICPEFTNDFFMNVARGVEDELRKYGYSVILCNSGESAERERDRLNLLHEKCVDGVIIVPASDKGSHMEILTRRGVPVVLVDRLVEGFDADSVLADNEFGTFRAVEHLIGQGHTRIGFIGGDMRLTSAKERHEGYKRALRYHGLIYDGNIVRFGDFHMHDGYILMKQLAELDKPPAYVFISNYYMHLGAAKYLMETGGTGICTAGFDDLELSSILGFCRVTVEQPMDEMGRKAAGLLVERINGRSGPAVTLRVRTRLKVCSISDKEDGLEWVKA